MPTPPFEYELSDRWRRERGPVLLTGVQALARLPLEQLRRDRSAGLNTAAFASGYPGSPLGGLDQAIESARAAVPELDFVHQPGVNEELAATSVMGSQLAAVRPDARYQGVTGYWYGKAPGLDRAGDAMRHGVFAGASPLGGAVVLVGDDPASKSSTMPSSSDATLVDLHMPILYPGTMTECLELGLHAVAMSRASGLWSSMKIVTSVADGSGIVEFPVLEQELIIPTIDIDGARWQCRPSAQFLGQRMTDVEREFREIRLPLAHRYGVDNGLNQVVVDPSDAWIGLVATGFTYYELVDALRRLGLEDDDAIASAGIRILQLRMPVPFDRDLVRRFARGLDEIVVVEEKNPTLEWLVKDALYGGADQPRVVGKVHEDGRTLMRSYGRLDADAILPGLRERLAVRLDHRLQPIERPREKALIPLTAARTPYFCSGCPHNWGTKVPDGALVGAGTGCHGMTLLMDADRVGEGIGITAMGNEGAQWVGMEPFVEADHLFQNYGDGTYFHSGQLAIQYCIGAGKNVTFKILYNSTVAMTGGQDSVSPVEVPQLAEILLAQGVKRVAITADDTSRYRGVELPKGVTVQERTEITQTQDELRAIQGVTVLIHDQECAAELRRGRRRGTVATPTQRVVINHRICEGCGDCGDVSNCLSVQPVDTPLGRKTTIDQDSCNFDYSCLEGDCPAFMTVELDPKQRNDGPAPATLPIESLPDPVYLGPEDRSLLRMAGIGGTGVVTVAQIVGTAAMFDGWSVHGLDQTGLSQKAGPVVSDVILTRPSAHSSNLVGDAQADLILGFDGLVASSDRVIRTASAQSTMAIVSTHRTPTGHMVTHPDTGYPTADIRTRLDEACDAGRNRFVDAAGLTETFVGSAAPTNVFLLGVAVQAGSLPLSVPSVSRAIELNGIAVDANQAAFEWGRRWAHDAVAVEAQADALRAQTARNPTSVVTVTELPRKLAKRVDKFPESMRDLVKMLTADLVGYQSQAYAGRFLSTVEAALERERQIGSSVSYTETVARSLHKLMAYKDEYEVARLMLLPEAGETVASVGGPGASFAWQLHPPILSALGRSSKIGFDQRTKPAFTALAAGKRVRGTKLDPFGRTHMRRTERELVTEFEESIEIVTGALTAANLDAAVALAQLPDQVRGFEELKLTRISQYRDQLRSAIDPFASVST